MKHRSLVVVLILFFSVKCVGQRKDESLLYTEKGKLRADTTLIISIGQLNKWKGIEDRIIKMIIEEVGYSTAAYDNNLSGNEVIKFDIDSTGKIIKFNYINKVGGGLEVRIENKLSSFEYIKYLRPEEDTIWTYYLPISLKMIDMKDVIKKEKFIPIIGNKYVYIQY